MKNLLVKIFRQNWSDRLHQCATGQTGKLRTYALFKTTFVKEKYFSVVKEKEVRKHYTSFRISAHRLEIETGRYKKIPVNTRLCKFCNLEQIEDEVHFLFHCNAYTNLRKKFTDRIINQCRNYDFLSDKNKLIWLMINESDQVINLFANFIFTCFKYRTVCD